MAQRAGTTHEVIHSYPRPRATNSRKNKKHGQAGAKTIVAAQCFKTIATQVEMFGSSIRALTQSSLEIPSDFLMFGNRRNDVPMQIDRVQLYVRHGMKASYPALGRAGALRWGTSRAAIKARACRGGRGTQEAEFRCQSPASFSGQRARHAIRSIIDGDSAVFSCSIGVRSTILCHLGQRI